MQVTLQAIQKVSGKEMPEKMSFQTTAKKLVGSDVS